MARKSNEIGASNRKRGKDKARAHFERTGKYSGGSTRRAVEYLAARAAMPAAPAQGGEEQSKDRKAKQKKRK
jgi:hypothetical protein